MALTQEKLQQKRQALIDRTALALSISSEETVDALSVMRRQSVRLNTLKAPSNQTMAAIQALGVKTSPVSWSPDCLFINEGLAILRDSSLAEDGSVYIQNAASWLPVLALQPEADDDVLDVCAAPGGKTSHIAQVAHNKARITANDNSRPRLLKMQHNTKRLGVDNISFTLHDASRLARNFEHESFDKILLDAPCSGEGMMTLDNKKDFESWSVAHIKRLQQLQKKIITQAWQLLKPGGRLVYSTCTMAPEENEAVIDYFLRHNDDVIVEDIAWLGNELENVVSPVLEWNSKVYDERINKALRLAPSEHVEAFFVISVRKELS